MVLLPQAPPDFSVDSLSFKRVIFRGETVAASKDLESLVEVLSENRISWAANDDDGGGASGRSLESSQGMGLNSPCSKGNADAGTISSHAHYFRRPYEQR